MNWIDYFLNPYEEYTLLQIGIEIIAATTGILSVYFSTKKNILVYPIGIISTSLYTYLLYQWELMGDMLINGYYTIMSIYGWWAWSVTNEELTMNNEQVVIYNEDVYRSKLYLSLCFIGCLGGVFMIYYFRFDSISSIPLINWVDSFYTAIFLVAMLLMAKKKIENWYFWIIGNLLAIPVFIIKGYGITAIQYLIFLILAIQGLKSWSRNKTRI